MTMEPAIEFRIRPVVGHLGQTAQHARQGPARADDAGATTAALPGTQFAQRGHSGGNRVSDQGPGADHATVAGRFGFADLLDLVNPLQHIPVISSLYREFTGDTISSPARVLGDTLYGGPAGLAFAVVNTLVAEIAGKTPGDALVSALFGGADETATAGVPAGQHGPGAPIAEARSEPGAGSPVARAGSLAGRAALAALVSDMRALERASGPDTPDRAPAPPPRGRAFMIRPQDRPFQSAAAASTHPTPVPTAAPDDAADLALTETFAQKMMTALDKYEALARAGKDDTAAKGSLLDQGL